MSNATPKDGGYVRVSLLVEREHWPWLVRHAERLGYFGPVDYLQGILGMALLHEEGHNEKMDSETGE